MSAIGKSRRFRSRAELANFDPSRTSETHAEHPGSIRMPPRDRAASMKRSAPIIGSAPIIACALALCACAGTIDSGDAVKDEASAIAAYRMGSQLPPRSSEYHARLRSDHWEVWAGPSVLPWQSPPCTEVLTITKRDGAEEWAVCAAADAKP